MPGDSGFWLEGTGLWGGTGAGGNRERAVPASVQEAGIYRGGNCSDRRQGTLQISKDRVIKKIKKVVIKN